jgi:hypothetical protein
MCRVTQKLLSCLMLRMCSQMPAMIHNRPVTSRELWVERVLMRVKISTIVPIIIRNKPIKGVNFFIKTLNLLQRYEIFHLSLITYHFFFVPLHPHFAKITLIY